MVREKYFFRVKDDIRVDIRFITEKGTVLYFAINVSLCTAEGPVDVYRADTAHGYLHEQRFWLSPKPRRLDMPDMPDYNIAFVKLRDEVLENFERWVRLFEEKRRKESKTEGQTGEKDGLKEKRTWKKRGEGEKGEKN